MLPSADAAAYSVPTLPAVSLPLPSIPPGCPQERIGVKSHLGFASVAVVISGLGTLGWGLLGGEGGGEAKMWERKQASGRRCDGAEGVKEGQEVVISRWIIGQASSRLEC